MPNQAIPSDKPWKSCQHKYNEAVKKYQIKSYPSFPVINSDAIVDAAINYVKCKSKWSIYPGKMYMIAIVYATMLSKVYKVDLYDMLDDPDLFIGLQDRFVRYSFDKQTYDEILKKLQSMPKWLDTGWIPQTIKHFNAQCTQTGLDKAIERLKHTGCPVEGGLLF